MQKAWIAAFENQNPDVKISYGMVGSGSGQERFIDRRLAYAGTDLPVARDRAKGSIVRCVKDGGALIEVPVYVSPIAIVYNLPGVEGLKLSPGTLAKIFEHEATRWDDGAIAGDNPGVELPHTRITTVNRSEVSGATKSLTEYLAKVAPAAWSHPSSDYWQASEGEVVIGDAGMVEAVAAEKGAIGYADAFHVGDGKVEVARIEVGDAFVAPTRDAAAKLFAESPRDRTLRYGEFMFPFALDYETEAPGSYPIVLVSYVIACTRYRSADEGKIVKRYLEFAVGPRGRELAENAGSAPLPPELIHGVERAAGAIEAR